MSLASQRILVVGGAKGIGRATTTRLTDQGARVVVWDRDPEALLGLPAAMVTETVDITERQSVAEAIARLGGDGVLHGVVISVGLHATCPAARLSDQTLERVMEVNFTAHAKLVRDLLPAMAPDGRIVGISSIAATVGIPMSAAYSASKAALELFYETLWSELRPRGIWPIIVQPGNVNTGFNETGNEFDDDDDPVLLADYRKVVERIHSRYGMAPDAVAQVIVKALAAPRPRCFYVAGRNALKAVLAKRVLGRQGALTMLRRHFGLSG